MKRIRILSIKVNDLFNSSQNVFHINGKKLLAMISFAGIYKDIEQGILFDN